MANNEISGPVVTTALVRWLRTLKHRRYTYRIVFVPETIGSIVYISKNVNEMKKNIKAGFVITCIGDNRTYSYLQSRQGNTLADQTAKNVLGHLVKDYKEYSFLERGSDERQYCSPGVDLPVISIMRSKYGTYPEYHTSLDDMSFISPEGLQGGYNILQKCIEVLESNLTYKIKVNCEPQLTKYGLYPTTSKKDSKKQVQETLSLIAYADGNHTLLEIANKIGVFAGDLIPLVKKILEANLFDTVKDI
jgi:aminopeptidase-like protein